MVPTKKTRSASFFRDTLTLHMLHLNVIFLLIASSVLAITHIIALQLFLYWHFSWFDLPMHFLGGAIVALAVFAGYALRAPIPKRYLNVIPILAFVLIVAFVWEIFELSIGIVIEDDYEMDTILDLIMGVIGGMVGYVVGSSVENNKYD